MSRLYDSIRVAGTITVGEIVVEGAFTLPTVDGSANQILVTDGAGNVTWEDADFVALVDSVNGYTGDVVLDTDDISEGASNLYWTQARFDTAFGLKSTTDLSEGSNLYFTNERVDDRVATLIQDGTGITWTYVDGSGTLTGNVSLGPFTTDDLTQGFSNLYYSSSLFDSDFVLKSIGELSDVDLIGSPGPQEGDSLRYIDGIWTYSTPVDADELSKVSANDNTADYLFNKITGSSNKIDISEVNNGGDESLNINIGSDVFDKTLDTTDNITEGISNLFFTNERVDDRVAALIQNSTTITWTYDDGSNTLTPSVNDNTSTQRIEVSKEAVVVGTRKELNFIEGSGISMSISDNSGDDRIDLIISASIDEFIALDDLTDVDITTVPPTSGDVLTYGGSPGEWTPRRPRRTWSWAASLNGNNVTDSYLRAGGNSFTNESSYRCAFACKITAISIQTDGSETWTGEIRKNGSVTPIASLSASASSGESFDGLNVSLDKDDVVEFYCNGTTISNPFITIWLEEE